MSLTARSGQRSVPSSWPVVDGSVPVACLAEGAAAAALQTQDGLAVSGRQARGPRAPAPSECGAGATTTTALQDVASGCPVDQISE